MANAMSRHDYAILGVERDATAGRDSGRVPPGRPRKPPGPEPRRRVGERAVQARPDRLRGARRPARRAAYDAPARSSIPSAPAVTLQCLRRPPPPAPVVDLRSEPPVSLARELGETVGRSRVMARRAASAAGQPADPLPRTPLKRERRGREASRSVWPVLAASGILRTPRDRSRRASYPSSCRAAHPGRAGRGVASCPFRSTAFFPAYNDAGTIASMVVTADRTLRELTDDYEVIVVNDGSPDHTGEVLADLQTRYPNLRVVTHAKNRGYGGALRSGFEHATKDLVFYTDGDAQYDPREFRLLAEQPARRRRRGPGLQDRAPRPARTASSSGGCTTPSCGRCSACRCATWTATCG